MLSDYPPLPRAPSRNDPDVPRPPTDLLTTSLQSRPSSHGGEKRTLRTRHVLVDAHVTHHVQMIRVILRRQKPVEHRAPKPVPVHPHLPRQVHDVKPERVRPASSRQTTRAQHQRVRPASPPQLHALRDKSPQRCTPTTRQYPPSRCALSTASLTVRAASSWNISSRWNDTFRMLGCDRCGIFMRPSESHM